MPEPAPSEPAVDDAAVVTKALLRAAARLELSRADVARIVGVSPSSASRLGRTRSVDLDTKEGELALLLLRVYRSLDSLFGGRERPVRDWFHSENHHLGGYPEELVTSVEGLVRVAGYLDAMRAKV